MSVDYYSNGSLPPLSFHNYHTCHVIIAQGPKMSGGKIIAESSLEFKHLGGSQTGN